MQVLERRSVPGTGYCDDEGNTEGGGFVEKQKCVCVCVYVGVYVSVCMDV